MKLPESQKLFSGAAFAVLIPVVLLISACSSAPRTSAVAGASNLIAENQEVILRGWSGDHWHHVPLPGKPLTQYSIEDNGDVDGLIAVSQGSASVLKSKMNRAAGTYRDVTFSWRADALIANADIAARDKDDSPVRVVFAFDGDRSRLSAKNEMLSELMRAISGEEMPYATLIYEWSNTLPLETIVDNPRTDRIKKMVMESGPGNMGRWRFHRRNLKADFERAFGEEPGELIGIGLMTDSDNTHSSSKGFYGPVRVLNSVPPAP